MIVEIPSDYKDSKLFVDILHEEEALCWLWAFPSIFPWQNPIVWLYTPVVGNSRWPGDLWGIDSNGDLLIIEAKQCKRRDDPFIDFLSFHKAAREEFSSLHWQNKWIKHYSSEISFPESWSERPPGKTDGILPRSNKRSHLRKWQSLAQLISNQIRDSQYAKTVNHYFQTREQLQDPTPFYFALMIETTSNQPIITKITEQSGRTLQALVGYEHVGVIAIHCRRISSHEGRIEVRSVQW